MVARGGGSIVNIASIYGLAAALAPNSPYNATKAGVMGLTRELAVEWASVGIRVNAIAPGFFATESSHARGHFADPRCARASWKGRRWAAPATRRAKGTAIYLASAASAMVTGQTLVVDGGWLTVALQSATASQRPGGGQRRSMPRIEGTWPLWTSRGSPAVGDILAMLAAQPSASFFESGVARAARTGSRARGVRRRARRLRQPRWREAGTDRPAAGARRAHGPPRRAHGGPGPGAAGGRRGGHRAGGRRGGACARPRVASAAADSWTSTPHKRTFRYEGEPPGRGAAFAVWISRTSSATTSAGPCAPPTTWSG